MDLTLFVVLLCLTLFLIWLGFYRAEHSELSLVGFTFLFLLALLILNNNIQHITGTLTNTSFNYSMYPNSTMPLVSAAYESKANVYTNVIFDGTLSHSIGYWLCIISVVGFFGVIIGLKMDWRSKL